MGPVRRVCQKCYPRLSFRRSDQIGPDSVGVIAISEDKAKKKIAARSRKRKIIDVAIQ